jgi:ATP adenylyltransferase
MRGSRKPLAVRSALALNGFQSIKLPKISNSFENGVVLHEQLWAPWRLAYIKQDPTADESTDIQYDYLPGADENCFICRDVAARHADGSSPDRGNLVASRSELSLVILNRFPYNNGHLLVAPLAHKARLDELTTHEAADLQAVIGDFVGRLERLMNAQGFNIGLNLGKAAGAGLPGHLHWHVVPRWDGDTNFMGVLAGVEVIPQSLDALWQLLQEAAE